MTLYRVFFDDEYEIFQADTVAEAIARLRAERPDLKDKEIEAEPLWVKSIGHAAP